MLGQPGTGMWMSPEKSPPPTLPDRLGLSGSEGFGVSGGGTQEAAMQTAWPGAESRSKLGKHGADGPGEGGGPKNGHQEGLMESTGQQASVSWPKSGRAAFREVASLFP